MKVIIAGSRNITEYRLLLSAVNLSVRNNIKQILSGGASGVDSLGERYAKELLIDLEIYPANWEKHGKAAGPIRNEEMAKNADALLAIWDGKSKGTKNMIGHALKYGLATYVFRPEFLSKIF